jgi:hypothetical protein
LPLTPPRSYHNQRISLTNALLLSKALNLTLLLPPAFLSSHHPISFRPIPDLHSKLISTVAQRTASQSFCRLPENRVLSASVAVNGNTSPSSSSPSPFHTNYDDENEHAENERRGRLRAPNRTGRPHSAVISRKKDRCKDWTSQTLVSWEFLVSLDSLRSKDYSFASWWSLDDDELLSLYNLNNISASVKGGDTMDMWLDDEERYDQQIHLTDNTDFPPDTKPSPYTSQTAILELARKGNGARHLRFGSLFGGERLVFPQREEEVGKGLWDWERWEKERLMVKRAMAIELDDGGLLKEVVEETRERLNGGVDVYPGGEGEEEFGRGYVGLHCRLSEK